ncbi:TetR/AcrR family transcriptional regulator [Kribbia dieselivorans]|uniref:TetR/AcrR family transcriptional regulator n=1 Tax=Kribbia dieselivorans TaxID=331526 RepID=UPI0008385EF0|nr:TetR/AcrR family transcriptional regulator [Kribbia dieselivorans]
MRADAQANREALLKAARTLFAAQGPAVPFSQIAAEAGVGVATLYRHFPTPEDLMLGLIERVLEQMAEVCARHLPGMQREPQATWPTVIDDIVALELGTLVPQLLGGRDLADLPAEILAAREQVIDAAGTLVDLAKEAGLVRADASSIAVLAGLGAITRPLPSVLDAIAPGMRDWLVEVYVAGLRPSATPAESG